MKTTLNKPTQPQMTKEVGGNKGKKKLYLFLGGGLAVGTLVGIATKRKPAVTVLFALLGAGLGYGTLYIYEKTQKQK